MKTHLINTPSSDSLKFLRENLDLDIDLTFGEKIPDPADYKILVGGVPSRDFIEASPYVKSLIIPWAGLPTATRELMFNYPNVSVHNLHHNAPPTAETALALLFAAAKFIVPNDQALRAHDWTMRYKPNQSMLLHGKTGLILGYGAIGRHVGRVLAAMEMRVLGVRKSPEDHLDEYAEIFGLEALPDLLPQADVVIIALPGTSNTEGLLGDAELAMLPHGAILVNVGRGPIVEAGALYRLLKEGHLKGAGIDVWYNYPTDPDSRSNTQPSDYPFHELENVVMSPHRGGGSEDSERLRMTHLAEMLNTAARGKQLPNQVDLLAGY